MPQFTQWNVPDPFPNVLYNPAAVDAAIAKTQSELGNLDINQQELQLKKDEFARGQSFADTWNKSIDGTTGTTGAAAGGGGGSGPPDPNSPAGQVAHRTAAFWSGQGFTPEQVAGIMAGGPAAESSFNTGASGDGGTSYGLYQHHAGRMEELKKRYGPNPTEAQQHEFAAWEISPQGPLAAVGARLRQTKTPQEAAEIWTRGFESPANVDVKAAQRAANAGRYLGYGIPTQPTTPVAPPILNPSAGPRVANLLGNAPITTGRYAPTITSPVAPATAPTDPAVATTPAAPVTTGQADDPNMAAVKQASAALLQMPEAEAAAAYPTVVRELQAQGLAMQAPPTYPGHAALQAIVGGGDATTAAVEPSRQAVRLGGTAAAGPAAGTETLPQIEQPHRLYQTGLAGVTINGPGNPLAPPPVVTAAAPAAPAVAPPGATRPPLEAPPAAPTRVIPREPLIQSGPAAGLTRTQAVTIGQMLSQGAKPAVVMQHADEMRHQNDVIRQGDATQAAIEQQANYERRQKAEQTAYDRAEKAKADAIAAAAEKRAADKAAAEAADPLQGKSEDERIERTLLQLAPKVRAGQPLSDAEKDQYTLLWNKYREGPIQQVPDGKGGTFTARVPREVPPDFPPPPGQRVASGPQAIPGTEKPPELAPPTITGGMLANGVGQRKIMAALTGLLAHPDAVGLKANAPEWLLQRTDPEGVRLRGDVSDVAGHEFHDLSGAAVSPSEASRLKFIPSEKDTAEALKTKLGRMLELNRETMLQSYRTYGPENGGRRLPAVEDAIVDSIPEAAMDMLKTKPETARDFDKKYGKGAAKLVLRYGG